MRRKIAIEQKLHQQSEEAKSEAERLPYGKEREALVRKARQLKTRLANRSMDILASVAAAEIVPPRRLAPHRSSYECTQSI